MAEARVVITEGLPMDLMVGISDTADVPDNAPTPRAEHFKMAVPLTDDIVIGPVHHELNKALFAALTPQGENVSPATDSAFALYGLWRRNAPCDESPRTPDPDRALQRAAAVLRLARPHTMSLGTTVRIAADDDGRRIIYPNLAFGPGSAAYVADVANRWIRDADVMRARELHGALVASEDRLPDRIKRAMYAHEMIHWQSSADVRWALLAMALEGLVHTHDRKLPGFRGDKHQFLDRWRRLQLQPMLDSPLLTDAELNEIYDHRSHTMHGGGFRELWERPSFSPLYGRAEEALRTITRNALLQPDFAAIFTSDDSVRQALSSTSESQ